MKATTDKPRDPARITHLKVQNFRALRDVEFKCRQGVRVLDISVARLKPREKQLGGL